jgi:hypothetical protein
MGFQIPEVQGIPRIAEDSEGRGTAGGCVAESS